MKNKNKPKLNDVIESLYEQINNFKKDLEEGNDNMKDYTSKLGKIRIQFNLDRYSEIKKENNLRLDNLFQEFEERHRTYNEEFLIRIKKNFFVRPVYIILVLAFFLMTTGLSLYNVGVKSSQIQNFETYLIQNPEANKHYRKWLRN